MSNTIGIFSITLLILLLIEPNSCFKRKFIHDQPQMITDNVNITTYAGETITLPCELSNLGNYHVNWLKIKDGLPLVLTVGYHQFSRNMRYRVARIYNQEKNVESWNFKIRKVTAEDSGLYECYVKLDKHKIKAQIYLDVKSKSEFTSIPRSQRLSTNEKMKEVNMEPNTWVKLRCNATNILSPDANSNSELQWFKDGQVIEQDSRRLKKWVASYDNSNYMELDLYAINSDDSGNYQCKRDLTILKNIQLYVNRSAEYQSNIKLILLSISFILNLMYL